MERQFVVATRDPNTPRRDQDEFTDEDARVAWIRNPRLKEYFREVFVPCEVLESRGEDIHVKVVFPDGLPMMSVVPRTLLLNKNEYTIENLPDRLGNLMDHRYVNDACILDALNLRLKKGKNYSFIYPLLCIMNPFKDLKNTIIRDFKPPKDVNARDYEPHIFAMVYTARLEMKKRLAPIAFVVSGESGSGKTETTKHIMKFLASSAHKSKKRAVQRARADERGSESRSDWSTLDSKSSVSTVQDIIMSGTPVLEAFGNAKTLRNDNSSRFGRGSFVYINGAGGLEAGMVRIFLLEKSRVVRQAPGERNFHIFYQILAALSDQKKKECGLLNSAADYAYLMNENRTIEAVDDAAVFEEELLPALVHIGLNGEMQDALFKVLAAVLLAGNLKFDEVTRDECRMSTPQTFATLCDLLGFHGERDELQKLLTSKKRIVPGGEVIYSPLGKADAMEQTRSLARNLYNNAFHFLVDDMNKSIDPATLGVIGNENRILILDIFGFEFFEVNTLEQLLINVVNEAMQQLFLRSVFESEKRMLMEEGADTSMFRFQDNVQVIQLIDNARPAGILQYLEEQCALGTGSDKSFLSTIQKAFEKHPHFEKPKRVVEPTFTILHTAAAVAYTVTGFREKNMDTLAAHTVSLLKKSKNIFVRESWASADMSDKKARANLISTGLSRSLQELLKYLNEGAIYFARCIRPNYDKRPDIFDQTVVYPQLQALSILDAIDLRKKGFSYKRTFHEFLKDHFLSLCLMNVFEIPDDRESAQQLCKKVLAHSGFEEGVNCMTARNVVFLTKHSCRLFEEKETPICRDLEAPIRFIRSLAGRGNAGLGEGNEFKIARARLIKIQAGMRMWSCRFTAARKRAYKLALLASVGLMKSAIEFKTVRALCVRLQRYYRKRQVRITRMKEAMATKIQAHLRRILDVPKITKAKEIRQRKRETRSATLIFQALQTHLARGEVLRVWDAKRKKRMAMLISGALRVHLARHELKIVEDERRWRNAARYILAAFRTFLARRALRVAESERRQLDAARSISTALLTHCARHVLNLQAHARRKRNAACLMTSALRAYLARHILITFAKEKQIQDAARLISAALRTHGARTRLCVIEKEILTTRSACLISAALCIHVARRILSVLAEEQRLHRAAQLMSAALRTHLCRRGLQEREEERCRKHSAELISSAIRTHLARRDLYVMYKHKQHKDASKLIVAALCIHKSRCALISRHKAAAAAVIQRGWRMHLAIQEYRRAVLRALPHKVAIIQGHMKTVFLRYCLMHQKSLEAKKSRAGLLTRSRKINTISSMLMKRPEMMHKILHAQNARSTELREFVNKNVPWSAIPLGPLGNPLVSEKTKSKPPQMLQPGEIFRVVRDIDGWMQCSNGFWIPTEYRGEPCAVKYVPKPCRMPKYDSAGEPWWNVLTQHSAKPTIAPITPRMDRAFCEWIEGMKKAVLAGKVRFSSEDEIMAAYHDWRRSQEPIPFERAAEEYAPLGWLPDAASSGDVLWPPSQHNDVLFGSKVGASLPSRVNEKADGKERRRGESRPAIDRRF